MRERKRKQKQVKGLVKLAMDLYEMQADAGRKVIFVHPVLSDIWETAAVKKAMAKWDNHVTYYDDTSGNYSGETRMRAMVADKGTARILEKAASEAMEMKDWLGRLLGPAPVEAGDVDAKKVYIGEEIVDEARAPENAEIEGAGAGGITFDAAVPPPLQAALRRLHQNLDRAHPEPGAGQTHQAERREPGSHQGSQVA